MEPLIETPQETSPSGDTEFARVGESDQSGSAGTPTNTPRRGAPLAARCPQGHALIRDGVRVRADAPQPWPACESCARGEPPPGKAHKRRIPVPGIDTETPEQVKAREETAKAARAAADKAAAETLANVRRQRAATIAMIEKLVGDKVANMADTVATRRYHKPALKTIPAELVMANPDPKPIAITAEIAEQLGLGDLREVPAPPFIIVPSNCHRNVSATFAAACVDIIPELTFLNHPAAPAILTGLLTFLAIAQAEDTREAKVNPSKDAPIEVKSNGVAV